jgi:orotate phosphoribosyltransferase
MAEPTLGDFIALVHGRRGHFRLESGYHAGLWLDLDALFASPRLIAPFVARLSDRLRIHEPNLVCGPMLGGALLAQSVATALNTEFCFAQPDQTERGPGLFRARYRVPAAFHSHVHGRRVAIVDDVMSAGSSLRATCTELRAHNAVPVTIGALLVLGNVGEKYFVEEQRLPVEAGIRDTFELWGESECPLCVEGVALEEPTWL